MNDRNRGLATLAVAAMAALIGVAALARPISVTVTGPSGSGSSPVVGLTVSGEGVVHAAPDIAYADFGVQGTGTTVAAARSEAAAAANRVLDALRAAGVADADVRTTGLSLYPTYPSYPCPVYAPDVPVTTPGSPEPGASGGSAGSGSGSTGTTTPDVKSSYVCDPTKPLEPNGWTYSQTFEATLRDIGTAGDTLDAVTRAGVTQISGIRFDLENRDALASQAREAAIKAARAKAEAMAKAAGASLGAVLSLSEIGSTPPVYYYPGAKDATGGSTTPVAPGTMDVTIDVTMSFALGS